MSYWKEENKQTIPLARPDITEHEINAVTRVLQSQYLSLGPTLKAFEDEIASYVGKNHAVAMNSGTSALFVALLAKGIGPGDEVIVPSYTFIATANVVRHTGATPVFADIKPDDYNMNPTRVEEVISSKTKAIIPVDVFGVPSDMTFFRELADKHDLFLLDDSCEALGAKYLGKHIGADADVSTFAFYPNKQITTGEGGVLATDNDEIRDLALSYRNQGRGTGSSWLQHVRIGYNFRMSDIQAALGLAQLQRISEILNAREEKAKYYTKRFTEENIEGLKLPVTSTPEKQVSWFVYVIGLPESYLQHKTRDDFIQNMKKQNIHCGKYFEPVHHQLPYKSIPLKQPLPVTEATAKRTVALPFYNTITPEQQERVIQAVTGILRSS